MDYGSYTYLAGKITGWTQAQADAVHGSAEKAFPGKAKYIWEEANNDDYEGFIYYGPEMATYFNSNGDEITLSNSWTSNEFEQTWNANVDLWNSVQGTDVRIVQPLGFPVLFGSSPWKSYNLNGEKYILYKLKHPDNDLGGLIMTDPASINDAAHMLINEVSKLIPYLMQTVYADSTRGFPRLALKDLVTNDIGPYWRFMYVWDLTREGFYTKILGDIEKIVQNYPRQGQDFDFDIITDAGAQWRNLLNI